MQSNPLNYPIALLSSRANYCSALSLACFYSFTTLVCVQEVLNFLKNVISLWIISGSYFPPTLHCFVSSPDCALELFFFLLFFFMHFKPYSNEYSCMSLYAEGKNFLKHMHAGGAFLVAQTVKNLLAMQEIWVQFLSWEDPPKKGMATYASILAWEIPWTEEPGGLWRATV